MKNLLVVLFSAFALQAAAQTPWVAPANTKSTKNPVKADAASIARGKAHFTKNCISCHGEKGLGDTPTGKAVKAANLKQRLPKQVDGEIHWKLMNGRGAMLKISTYKLNEKDGWDIINYLRTLTK
jgi:mono/diheme cytochrome c family protein